jgi:lipopolysaccharide/colanic/teichoic acid biosynthesis glycosyltransferase
MSMVRGFDGHRPVSRVVAAIALVVVSPVLLLAVVAIKVSSRGPVLYTAPRVGLSGRPFVMLKLRTMHQTSSQGVHRITGAGDPRVFAVGRWLRRLKVDELPQLINVVRGEMALVGPRPEDPGIVAAYYTPFLAQTLAVHPGLTSPGSLDYFARESALPSDPVEAERVYVTVLLPRKAALDLVYIQNRTWRYDVQLVVRTVASLVGTRTLFRRRRSWERLEAAGLMRAAALAAAPSVSRLAR